MKTLGKWFSVLVLSLPPFAAVGCASSPLLDGLAATEGGSLGPPAAEDPCVGAAYARRQTCIGAADFRSSVVRGCNRAFDESVAACRRGPDARAGVAAKPVPSASDRSASFVDPKFISGKW